MSLSFGTLMAYLNRTIGQIADPRQASNSTRYSLRDIVLAAFSVFFMQCASFLEHQRQLQSRFGKNNATQLFEVLHLPSDPQIRNVLDRVCASGLFGIFGEVYGALRRGGYLRGYEQLGGDLLVALDGTQYFQSEQIHCPQCNHRQHQNGTVSYFHSAILPVIVAPGRAEAISLAPELITPQDGAEKQDCEVNAAKRWLQAHAGEFQGQAITYLGDDLYGHQPMCETVLAQGHNFIFTCLPESHPELEKLGEVHHLDIPYDHLRSHQVYHYRFVNQVPLRATEPALLVNWCELTLTRAGDGKVLYHNAWVTRHALNHTTVAAVVAAGRGRWKTENENHNVLKTKGYHLEHNFGHGEQHLAATLLTLNLLAFLFHTVLQLVDNGYQQMRQKRGTRQGFFQDIQTLTQYLLFDSWQALIDFMLTGQPKPYPFNSS
jgi:hypothetical protein